MTVPFEALGPGQSGRLVYQVMGDNGPIFNPNRIRYLSPNEASAALGPESTLLQQPLSSGGVSAAFSALNLAASVGALSVASATLYQVRQLHNKVDQVLYSAQRIETGLENVINKLDRIETRVAENNLRHALDHVLNRAILGNEIDLKVIARLKNDLETFEDSIGNGGFRPYSNFSIRLSSDIEDKLNSILQMLTGLRLFIYQQHNRLAKGDPARLLTIDLEKDYLIKPDVEGRAAAIHGVMLKTLTSARQALFSKVLNGFTFADKNTATKYFEWLWDAVGAPMFSALFDTNAGSVGLAQTWDLTDRELDKASEFYELATRHWLWHTSAGLLWRTYLELSAIGKGYENVWPIGKRSKSALDDSQLLLNAPLEQETLEQGFVTSVESGRERLKV